MADAVLSLEKTSDKNIVVYLDYDNTYLYAMLLQDGGTAIDSVGEGLIDAPTRDADADGTTYTYLGWDSLPESVTDAIMLITATYESTVAEYEVGTDEVTVTTYKGISAANVLTIANTLGYSVKKTTQGYFYFYYDADSLVYSAATSSTTKVVVKIDSKVSQNIMVICAGISNITTSKSGNVITFTRNTSTSTIRALIISAETYEEYYDELFSSYTLTQVATY